LLGCVHDGRHGASASVEVLDGLVGAWADAPLMSGARIGACAAAVDGRLLVMGGVSGDSPLATVEVFDPQSGSWAEGPPLPAPRAAACAAVLQL